MPADTEPVLDSEILASLDGMEVGHRMKVTANYQAWDFPCHFRLNFKPTDSVERRREMIRQAYSLVHRIIKSDIRNNMNDMRATIGDHPVLDQIEGLLK